MHTAGTESPPTGTNCLDGITDYENPGPFKFAKTSSSSVAFWVPMVPSGCRVPVVHFAIGTGATCSVYQGILERLATHGFLTTCYDDPNTGAGTQGITALASAIKDYASLVDNKVGLAGQGQGGQAAFVSVQLAERMWGDKMVYAGLAIEPTSGIGTQPAGGTWQEIYAQIKSPMFMFSGSADTLVSEGEVQLAFDALSTGVESYWYSAVGATSIPPPVAPTQQIAVPWFRWKLLGDAKACAFFKKLPDGDAWDPRKEKNAQPCR